MTKSNAIAEAKALLRTAPVLERGTKITLQSIKDTITQLRKSSTEDQGNLGKMTVGVAPGTTTFHMAKLVTKNVTKVHHLIESDGPFINSIQADFDEEFGYWTATTAFACTRATEEEAIRGLVDELQAFLKALEESSQRSA